MSQSKTKGFTLIEVLIAVAIFALISMASVGILQTVINSGDVSKNKTERINELQRAFLLIERDVLQIARRSVRFNGEAPLTSFIYVGENEFSDAEQGLAFVRHGWTNPGLLLPRSDMQLVAYQLNEKKLERVHFNFVDSVVGEEPKVRTLISNVESLDIEFFDGKKWQESIPQGLLPMAIAIEIDTLDFGVIRRQFLVAGDITTSSVGTQG